MSLDDYVCERFQALSDLLEGLTGKSCYWFACLLLTVAGGFTVLDYRAGERSVGWAIFDLVGIAALIHTVAQAPNPNDRASGAKTASPFRHDRWYKIARLLFLFTFGLEMIVLLLVIAVQAPSDHLGRDLLALAKAANRVGWAYFMACSPGGGSKYLISKWADALARKLFGNPGLQGT